MTLFEPGRFTNFFMNDVLLHVVVALTELNCYL